MRNRKTPTRHKNKRKRNRYNPNQPDWRAVHAPWTKLLFGGKG